MAKRGGGRFRTRFFRRKVNKNNDIKYRYGFCLVAIQRYLVSFFCFRRKGVDSAWFRKKNTAYEEHSKYIKLAQTTKITVEYILDNMKKKLQALQYADQSAMQPGA